MYQSRSSGGNLGSITDMQDDSQRYSSIYGASETLNQINDLLQLVFACLC